MNQTDIDRIRREGAQARARGATLFENPYTRPENLPAATGEPQAAWEAKHKAWIDGWDAEDHARVR